MGRREDEAKGRVGAVCRVGPGTGQTLEQSREQGVAGWPFLEASRW